MKLLLDSNALLWWTEGGEELSSRAFEAISAPGSQVALSVATVWELEIKSHNRKLDLRPGVWSRLGAIDMLPIDLPDALAAAGLPPHHRDPFDRMIIAQALNRGLTIVTRDRAFDAYGVALLAA